MWTPGIGEIVVILAAALIIFGPRKLPELAKSIGTAVTEFKKGISGVAGEDTKNEPPKISNTEETKEKEEDKTGPAG